MARILVVDDEHEIVDILGKFFQKNGFEIIECVGGRIAIDVIKRGDIFDLVVLDIKMPEVDGAVILAELKKMEKKVPVILVTGDLPPKNSTTCNWSDSMVKHQTRRYGHEGETVFGGTDHRDYQG
ncbi:MAG: response regulator, partial [Candidatus Omnitrophota bacterium]